MIDKLTTLIIILRGAMNKERFGRLLDLMHKENLDAIVLNPGFSFKYLANLEFHLMERPTILVITKNGESQLILPELEASRALKEFSEEEIFTYSDNPALWSDFFKQTITKLNLGKCSIGVEANRFRFLELELIQNSLPDCKIVSANSVFSNFRIIKNSTEIEYMREAALIAQNALIETLKQPVVGMTEINLASLLTINLLKHGSGELPFSPIIAAGPNSADPHATPSDHVISTGELLLFDWGASYKGYASDITRTFAVGTVDPMFYEIAKLVGDANKQGRLTSKPGVTAGSIDDATRAIITNAGFGEYFNHRTGHGLGMDAHESPYIFSENQQILEPGMVFTIEPGVYLPGKGGVRIEDDVVITDTGSRSLTDLPRDLKQIG